MKNKTMLVVLLLASFQIFCNPYDYSSKSQDYEPIKDLVENEFQKWINSPIIVNAIKDANVKNSGRTEAEILAQDNKWRAGDTSFQGQYSNNAASMFLKGIKSQSKNLYSEIFIMDFQGCNVALSDLTSDFWQGDEGKFKNSYNGGAGAVFIDEIELDESTGDYLVQVSLPIVDASTNKVIGAITIGVDMAKL
ncbi:MAG: PDC sensor domain-containing protein [Spirochaetaceae bacterium]